MRPRQTARNKTAAAALVPLSESDILHVRCVGVRTGLPEEAGTGHQLAARHLEVGRLRGRLVLRRGHSLRHIAGRKGPKWSGVLRRVLGIARLECRRRTARDNVVAVDGGNVAETSKGAPDAHHRSLFPGTGLVRGTGGAVRDTVGDGWGWRGSVCRLVMMSVLADVVVVCGWSVSPCHTSRVTAVPGRLWRSTYDLLHSTSARFSGTFTQKNICGSYPTISLSGSSSRATLYSRGCAQRRIDQTRAAAVQDPAPSPHHVYRR